MTKIVTLRVRQCFFLLLSLLVLLYRDAAAATAGCKLGKSLWAHNGSVTPLHSVGLLYGPLDFSPTRVQSINLRSGEVLWTRRKESARYITRPTDSCVFPDRRRVVAVRSTPTTLDLEMVDVEADKPVWLVEVPGGSGEAVATCYDGYVVVEFGTINFSGVRSASYAAFNISDGKLLWTLADTSLVPVFGSRDALVWQVFLQSTIREMDPVTGTMGWNRTFDSRVSIFPFKDFLYVAHGPMFSLIDLDTGRSTPEANPGKPAIGSPDAGLYLRESPTTIKRLSRETFQTLWTVDMNSKEITAIKGVGVSVLARNGETTSISLLEGKKGNVLFTVPLPGKTRHAQIHFVPLGLVQQFYLTFADRVQRLDPSDGSVIWKASGVSTGTKYRHIIADKETIYIHQAQQPGIGISRPDRGAIAMNRDTGDVSWRLGPRQRSLSFYVKDMSIAQGRLLTTTSNAGTITTSGLQLKC